MIDFSAREQHFADHLTPIWDALPPDLRGVFFVGLSVAVPGRSTVAGWPARTAGPVVCASWGDLREVRRLGRPVVFCEHGAGQSYGSRHPSYVGGRNRESVVLFLVPNQQAAARNRRFYPRIPNIVIGSPRVDQLRRIRRRPEATTAAISFHWRCRVAPESESAADHYVPALATVRESLAADGIVMVGHGHPRIFDELAPVYEKAGIEPVRSFAEVVARADVFACDNSSALFEFAALDRPVVVLNCPRYRKKAHHGLRFWDEADVGVQIDGPDDLPGGFREALADCPARQDARRASVGRVYPAAAGTAARLAADAVATHVAGLVAV